MKGNIMTRDKMIQILTDNMVDTLRSDYRYTRDVVMCGFTGYSNYTDEELECEYRQYMDNFDYDLENDVA
jgi:hypothetical protein